MTEVVLGVVASTGRPGAVFPSRLSQPIVCGVCSISLPGHDQVGAELPDRAVEVVDAAVDDAAAEVGLDATRGAQLLGRVDPEHLRGHRGDLGVQPTPRLVLATVDLGLVVGAEVEHPQAATGLLDVGVAVDGPRDPESLEGTGVVSRRREGACRCDVLSADGGAALTHCVPLRTFIGVAAV